MSRLEPRASLGISKMGEPAMNAQQRPHMVSTIEALSRKLGARRASPIKLQTLCGT